ncbi:MAG: glycosyltransferase [Pseudomonadales bacterium]|nr:glycosyltransferase [Pseudomonadales bacterium]
MGGAERQVCDLADQYFGKGHQVMLVSLSGTTIQRPRNQKVQLISLCTTKSFFSIVRSYIALHKYLKVFKPDVVHSHLIHANIFTRLLRLTMRMTRLVNTSHNIWSRSRLGVLAYRCTDRLADLSTNVSDKAVQSYIDAGATREGHMITVYNGINVSEFQYNVHARTTIRNEFRILEDSPLLLAVGRMTREKDYPNMLHAFCKVQANIPTAILLIVGIGALSPEITDLARKLNIHNSVQFLGLRKNIPELMSAADMLILSSANEGFGLVVAEAMACERIVVATDCGGIREVLGDTRPLVPRQNSSALADAIIEALSIEEVELKRQGKIARKRIEDHFSLETIASNWIDLYKQL